MADTSQQNPSCLLYGPLDCRYEDRPIPPIQDPHDILVRISYVGVCGSDVHFWQHGGMLKRVSQDKPMIMGHEASGIVHSVGSSVTSLKPGDKVALEPGQPCRRCRLCKSGRYNICPEMKFAASPPNHGTLTKYYRIPEDFALKIPEAMSLKEAVLMEPLSVAVHANRLGGPVGPGTTVAVMGAGTIGLLVAAVAKVFGARRVVMMDILESKLEFARGYLGEDVVSTLLIDKDASPEENAARIRAEAGLEEGGRDGVDVVLEATGVESSAQTGVYLCGRGATFVEVGMGKAMQALPMLTICGREITVKGCFRYGSGDYQLALGFVSDGKVAVQPLISGEWPFEQAHEAWESTRKGRGIKNLIRGVQD